MKTTKIRTGISLTSVMLGGIFYANAATMTITNVSNGFIDPVNNNPGDTLWALKNNTLMDSGLIVMGYFNVSTILTENVDTIPELVAQLPNFIPVASLVPGSFGATLTGSFPGYAEGVETTVLGGQILAGTSLIGREIYQIITNAPNLASATGTSQFALLKHGSFTGDDSGTQAISGFPVGLTPIISDGSGTFEVLVTDALQYAGVGTYNTLRLAAVPEPSTALIGALGTLIMLRRRRA